MKVRCFLLAVAVCAPLWPPRALAACKIARIAELPVTMAGTRPLVPAKINGADAEFVLDSGAFYSVLTPAGAAEYKLHTRPAPPLLQLVGVGGAARTSVATVQVLTLANAPLHDVDFLVGGGEVGAGAVGVLGQNILRLADAEYDFANGVVRLWRAESCRKAMLAYWVTSQPYSAIKIAWTSASQPHTTATASLDGHEIRVMFDSGASSSMVSLRAAKSAGFNPSGPNVISTGPARGVGESIARDWIATFASFKIGDEEIHNARLHVIDVRIPGVDMLLGTDFFLSHRIYVATSQDKLYFTYNGGPVFNFSTKPRQAVAASAPSGSQAESSAAEPTDATGFARRGAALLARRDFAHAIADLTQAVRLEPSNAQYFYERGQAQLGNRQPALALQDFNHAVELDPSDAQALVSRASLRIARHDTAGGIADLDAADRAAARQADIRLNIAMLDVSSGRYGPAVTQFDLWLASHDADSHKPEALNGRCWARALWGRDLKQALSDCDLANRLRPATASFLDSRALVEQRLGKFARSIEDDDAAHRLAPTNAWFLYSRGVTELRAGHKTEGRADIASAVDLQPNIVQIGRERGVTP